MIKRWFPLRSQASESGSADDVQSQVLEWQEMVAEAASARERAKEEKAAMALRISHMEEEREGETSAGQTHKVREMNGATCRLGKWLLSSFLFQPYSLKTHSSMSSQPFLF